MRSSLVKFMFAALVIACFFLIGPAVAAGPGPQPDLRGNLVFVSNSDPCFRPWEECKSYCFSVPNADPWARENCVAVCNAAFLLCQQSQ